MDNPQDIMIIFSTIRMENWQWQHNCQGHPYNGETQDGVPHGYGIMGYAGEDGKITSIYVGAFDNGVRSGRGFLLNLQEEVVVRERPATYEDVMSTAEFDACGRPIHYQNITTVTTRQLRRLWHLSDDGIWADDRLAGPAERDFSAWNRYYLKVSWSHIENGVVKYHHLDRCEEISLQEDGGCLDLDAIFYCFLTPLPDGRLLVLDDAGACCAMAPDTVWTFDSQDSRYTYSFLLKD